MDRNERHAVQDALFTYVKNEQAPTFTVDEFAERYVPLHSRDHYRGSWSRSSSRARGPEDASDLRGRLKRRKFRYGTDIEFSASPEAIAEGRVSIDTVPSDHAGAAHEATVITIQDPFVRET